MSQIAYYYIPCHWLFSIIFLVNDCPVFSSLSLTAKYYIPCHWMLSIIFLVTDCSVLYSLSLSALYYIPCHWMLSILLLVTDCSDLYYLSLAVLVTDCSILNSLSPTFSVFYSLSLTALFWTILTLIDMCLFLATTEPNYSGCCQRQVTFFRSSAVLIVNVIVDASIL